VPTSNFLQRGCFKLSPRTEGNVRVINCKNSEAKLTILENWLYLFNFGDGIIEIHIVSSNYCFWYLLAVVESVWNCNQTKFLKFLCQGLLDLDHWLCTFHTSLGKRICIGIFLNLAGFHPNKKNFMCSKNWRLAKIQAEFARETGVERRSWHPLHLNHAHYPGANSRRKTPSYIAVCEFCECDVHAYNHFHLNV
jgi:hypothetical protein